MLEYGFIVKFFNISIVNKIKICFILVKLDLKKLLFVCKEGIFNGDVVDCFVFVIFFIGCVGV